MNYPRESEVKEYYHIKGTFEASSTFSIQIFFEIDNDKFYQYI